MNTSPTHLKRARDHRADARRALREHWLLAGVVTLLAFLLGAKVLGFLLPTIPSYDFNLSIDLPTEELQQAWQTLTDPPELSWQELWQGTIEAVRLLGAALVEAFRNISEDEALFWSIFGPILAALALGLLVSLAISTFRFVLGSVIDLGLARFRISLLDGKREEASVLFWAFQKHFFKALWLRVLRMIYIFLWSLLFIIPGIIAAYRYSMATYALAENPDMSPTDALRESARMMDGHKWRLFCLRCSFLGWFVLCALTGGILSLGVGPYYGQAEASFYDEVSGRAKVREMVGEIEFV